MKLSRILVFLFLASVLLLAACQKQVTPTPTNTATNTQDQASQIAGTNSQASPGNIDQIAANETDIGDVI